MYVGEINLDGERKDIEDKDLFLTECTQVLFPVYCIDIKSDSIKISISANSKEKLDVTKKSVAETGLKLPSYGHYSAIEIATTTMEIIDVSTSTISVEDIFIGKFLFFFLFLKSTRHIRIRPRLGKR